jgi:hypothetical protein
MSQKDLTREGSFVLENHLRRVARGLHKSTTLVVYIGTLGERLKTSQPSREDWAFLCITSHNT